MKIGILTFHNADNYGALLQCYALQETLKTLCPCAEVCVIDYRNKNIENSYRVIYNRKNVVKNMAQFLYAPVVSKKRKAFKNFRKRFLNLSSCGFDSCDIIFYGSDQIWNTTITDGDLMFFGKNFGAKKIAYAASDGGELVITGSIKSLLLQFDKISVREKSLAQKFLAELKFSDIQTVCDPVFLLPKEKWLTFAKLPSEKGYVLAYKIADVSDFDAQVESFAAKVKKPVIQIVYLKSLKKLFYKKQKFAQALSPNEFAGYFINADFVITTSFHGTAFSILFEKPFYVLAFENRNERILNLLETFKLKSNWISSVEKIDVTKNISNARSTKLQNADYVLHSKKFIEDALKNTPSKANNFTEPK